MKASFRTLLIVDLQQAFPVPPRVVEGIRAYAKRFETRIFTRFVNPRDSLFRRQLSQRCCAPGSEDTQLLVSPGPDDIVVTKAGYGLPPPVLRRLRPHLKDGVVVCGIDTDACVLGVMFSLFDAKIPCRLKASHCWSSSGLHSAAVRIVEQQFEVI